MEYKFEFKTGHFNTDNFKQKSVNLILGIIGGGRLVDFMRFNGYANISFDESDTAHKYPTITMLDKFHRLKSNCLVFDLSYNTYNNGKFDKCFVYQSLGRQYSNYGYVFYNSKTGAVLHKYFVEFGYDELCQSLHKTFHSLIRDELWINYNGKKYDSTKGRKGLTLADCPTIIDYHIARNKLQARYNIKEYTFQQNN